MYISALDSVVPNGQSGDRTLDSPMRIVTSGATPIYHRVLTSDLGAESRRPAFRWRARGFPSRGVNGKTLVEKKSGSPAGSSLATTPLARLCSLSACQRARVTSPGRPTVHIVVSSASEITGDRHASGVPRSPLPCSNNEEPPTNGLALTNTVQEDDTSRAISRGVTGSAFST